MRRGLTLPSRARHKGYALVPPLMSNVRPMSLLQAFRRYFVLLLCCSLFAGVAFSAERSDAQLRSSLVGRWQEFRDLGCEKHQQTILLRSNGTFQVTGHVHACDEEFDFVWEGKWRVKNSKFFYKTTQSSRPDYFPIGEELSDSIVLVSDEEWVMVEVSTGNESHAFRVK